MYMYCKGGAAFITAFPVLIHKVGRYNIISTYLGRDNIILLNCLPGVVDYKGDSRLLLEVSKLGKFPALAEGPAVVADDGDDGAVALYSGQDVTDEAVYVRHGGEVVLAD